MATKKEEEYSQEAYQNAIAQATTGTPQSAVDANGKPIYAGTYEGQLADTYNKIQNREDFKYDVNADPLYQQYKDQYVQGGKLAMRDTMGKAAALTGGYASTYGQQVGQQAYDSYLQNLTNQIPELYSQAYSKYADEGNQLLNQYNMLGNLRDTEYSRYRNELGDWENERAWQAQQEQAAFTKQQQLWSNLYTAIGQTGYVPTDDELNAAGMTRAQANALKAMWDKANTPVAVGGGWSSPGSTPPDGSNKSAYQVGVDIGKTYGQNAALAYLNQNKDDLTKQQKRSVYQGIVDSAKLAYIDK